MAINPYDDILKRTSSRADARRTAKAVRDSLAARWSPERWHSSNYRDLHGLGKEIWKDVDADEYVAGERDSWDG